MKLMIFWTGVL